MIVNMLLNMIEYSYLNKTKASSPKKGPLPTVLEQIPKTANIGFMELKMTR